MNGNSTEILRYEIWAIIIIALLGVFLDANTIWAHDRDLENSQEPKENTSYQDDSTNSTNRNHSHTTYKKAGSIDRKISRGCDKFDSVFSETRQQWKPQHLKYLFHRQSVWPGPKKRYLISHLMRRWRLRCRKPKRQNPQPFLLSINPTTIEAGSPEFFLTVTGNNFLKRSTISFNNRQFHPTYLSRTQLEVSIPAEMIETPGEYPINIINPRPGGGRSEAINLAVIKATQVELPPEGSYGKRYEKLIPYDATIESYDPKRFSLITGNAKDRSLDPIPELMVSIHGHPEYGSVKTNSEGRFSIPVEGGGTMTIKYEKSGFITAHRKVSVPWNDIAITDTITMIAEDTVSTTVTFNGNPSTVITHKSSPVTDEHGSRSATMVFRGDNRAFSLDESGNEVALTSITTRATEFETPKSMPARLPPNSAFTYCAELSIDGISSVRFEKPVSVYIDNFLGFQVGEVVPVGYYDRKRAMWVPSESGVVVMLLDTDNDGIVDALDSTGDSLPDDLNSNGSFRDEVFGLNDPAQYSPNYTYWRFETVHFSPWDCNWPFGPPADAVQPTPEGEPSVDQQKTIVDDIDCTNSYIERRSRIFHEDIPIPGTDISLHYASNRVRGYKSIVSIPVSGESVPTSLKGITVRMSVAGQEFEQTLDPLPDQKVEFVWDGRDYLGNSLSGLIEAEVSIGFVYDGEYQRTNRFGYNGNGMITGVRARQEVTSWKRNKVKIYRKGGIGTIAEGWTLSAHHFLVPYDPNTLYKGDGTTNKNKVMIIATVAGNGDPGFSGDGGPATEASLWWPTEIKVDRAGNIYIAVGNQIRKVDTDGIITTIAGSGEWIYSGDGGPATEAGIRSPSGIAVDYVGNIYLTDHNNRIRKVDTTGIITTIAGNGELGYSGDGGLATEAGLRYPHGVAVDNVGNIYITDIVGNRIRKVDTEGIITTIAGNGEWGFSGDGGPASEASFWNPRGVVVDDVGNIIVVDASNNRIRKIDTSGIITTIAGNWQTGYSEDGGLATEASLLSLKQVTVDSVENIYITEGNRIRKVDTNGIITTIAGTGEWRHSGDGGPAMEASLYGSDCVAIDSAGNIYIADSVGHRIRKVSLPGIFAGSLTDGATTFTDNNGLGYIMDSTGLHTSTVDLSTGNTLFTFGYDQESQLVTIIDQFDNRTTIQRDSSGVPISITSPDGITTSLRVDTNNHLADVTYPDDSTYSFTYTPDGLMTDEYDLNGNHFEHRYDGGGKVTDILDPEGGQWTYSRVVDSNGNIATNILTGEENLTTYEDRTESTGAYTSVKRGPTGALSSIFHSSDGLSETRELSCGMILDMKYGLDPEYRYKYLKETTRTTPESLVQTTTNNRIYDDTDADDVVDKITDTVTVNGNEWISTNNTLTGMITNTSPLGRETTTKYNTTNLLTEEIAVTGLLPTTFNYDDRGRLIGTTIGDRTTTRAYDGNGNLDFVITPDNKTLDYDFDIMGHLRQEVRPDGTSIRYGYDVNGNMTLLVTPKEISHTFGHTGNDQRREYAPPISGRYLYLYDKERKLKTLTYPSGSQILNTYTDSLLTETVTPEGTIDFTYGCASLPSEVINGTEKITYTYDGSLLKKDSRSGILTKTINYTYDNDFRLSSITYAGLTDILGYDDDGLLTSAGNYIITRNTDNGLPESVSDGVSTQFRSFNGYGEIDRYSHDVNSNNVYDISVTRDNTGRIIQKREVIGAETITWGYRYDELGRLREVKKNNSVVESYGYDANGNRTRETNTARGITDKTFDYTNEDHIITAGNEVYVFDEDGFLAEKVSAAETTSYNYSLRGELLDIDLADGRSVTYDHDPMGRRITKRIDGTVVEKYLWAGNTTLLAVYDGSDNLIERFDYAGGRLPISMLREGTPYYMIYDQVGALRLIVDSTGNITKRIDYDSFGNIINDTNPGFTIPFGFAGGLHDRDTSLIRFGARDYDPTIGRWTAKDPIDFAGGDVNLYGYVLNDPVNFIDPEGLWSIDIGFTGGTGRAGVNIGIKIGSSGAYGYYGFGLGGGFGVSVTASTETPSSGVDVTGVARAGTGTWGGYGSVSVDTSGNVTPNVGGGWGIGFGWNVGASHLFGYSLEQGLVWGIGDKQKYPCR